MPSRQEKKKAKRRAKYLKTRDDVLDSARAENCKAEPEKKRASQLENYRAEPEWKRTSRHARYRADPEKERAAKRQRYCHSPERASRSAKRVKVTQRYVVPLQPPSHISRWITMAHRIKINETSKSKTFSMRKLVAYRI